MGSLDLKPVVDDIKQELAKAKADLKKEGLNAGEAVGSGWDEGFDTTVEKIKASSIKTEKAFSKLSEKIRKQVQQLSTNLNGKGVKFKIDFSDIDINSDAIKEKVNKIVKDFSTQGLIEFDTKGSEQQFKNLITLYVKYQEKLNSLQKVSPSLSSPKDIEGNLQQQFILASKLKEIWVFLDRSSPINGYAKDLFDIQNQLEAIQKITKRTQSGDSKVTGNYNELAKVLKEIQGSLKIISDTFKNENNSMQTMAENNVTSFKSLSEAIVSVYNNLSQVQSLVDSISKKDFNITNITQTGGAESNLQAMTQQMTKARETMEHLRQLYDQAGDTLQGLGSKGQIELVMEHSKQLQELNMTDISKSVKKADTEMKLASVIAEMEDYIDKLTQINKLRNQYGLGEWKDTFVSTQKPVSKPIVQQKSQTTTSQVSIPQTVTSTTNTEAQQMWQLKAAIDEVSNAIGRKNAGFIKEQEIVNTSVEAEKAKLKELVVVLTTDIGGALENLKKKFTQSFVVPELDKNALQASFDEIYNKFIELKNKIGSNQIDFGINTTNITTAIQEALYAKEILSNYTQITKFDQVFDDFTWGYDTEAMNKFTNEILSMDNAIEEFEKKWKNTFVSKNGYFHGNKEEMLSNIINGNSYSVSSEQDNWAKVIVDAINTQGGKIVESIKLLLPKNISDSLNIQDDAKFSDAFQTLSRAISTWSNDTRLPPGEFFNRLRQQQWSGLGNANTTEVKNALYTLGLTSNGGKPTFTIADEGMRNLGVAIADKFVLPTRGADLDQTSELIPLLNEANQLGASVPRIISAFNDGSKVFELQTRMLGKNIASDRSNPEFLNASNEQIDRLIHTFEVLSQVGLYPDFIGDNVLFDKQKGFSLVDLETSNISWNSMDTPEDMVKAFLRNALRGLNQEDTQDFRSRVNERLRLPSEQRLVNADTIANEKINSNQNKAEDSLNKVKITPTMDEGAVARIVEENVSKTPATVKVTPIIDTKESKTTDNNLIISSVADTQQSINGESQSTVDTTKSFIDAANAKKQFVEANKNVAESAQSSEGAVKKEAEAAKKVATDVGNTASQVGKDVAKIKDVYNNYGDLIKTDTTRKFKTDKAVVSETESTRITMEHGNEIRTVITTIVKDFKKFNQEEKKTEEAIARAQSKLDEFIKKFKSKTGGNAQFIEGFNELSNFKINKDNIEEAFNKLTQLQARYNELEGNFRKGQSSLNPFTNAITKASNIDNIFGDVEFKFNSLSNKSDELVKKFTKLQETSKKIKDFVDIINTNPNSITPDQFTEFSKYVGEFNLLKTQVEGSIKREKRIETEDSKKQIEAYKEILRLVKERNDALTKAAKSDNGSIKQRNALIDAYKIQQQLHTLGKQIVLTDQQRSELARVREEQARKIRDIETDIATKNANQRDSAKEKIRVKAVEDYINLIKQRNEYELKAAKGGAMQSVYEKKVNELKEKIAQNDKQSIMNQEEKNKLTAIEVKHQEKLSELKNKQDSLNNFQKQNDTIRSKFDAGYLSEDSFKKWQNNLSTYQSYLDGTVSADEETIKEEGKILTQLYDQLIKASNKTKAFYSSGGQILSKWFNSDEIKNAEQSLQELYKSIASDRFGGMKTAITSVNGEIGKLTFTVDNGKGSLASYSILLDKSTGATKLLGGQTKETLTTLQKFGSALKGDVRGLISAFIGGMSTLYTVGRYIREGIQSVKELDAALTELKKVTDETEATYDKFLQIAGKTSARIGSTLTNMTSATAEFAKLGYNIEEASNMAESALVYTNVGDDVDVETGSQSIISTMKAFGVEANNTMSIVDKFNEVNFLPPYTVMYM